MSIRPNGAIDALISLGGNVGDVLAAMQRAITKIDMHPACSVLSVSRVYKTPPWGVTDQDWFFNAASRVNTTLKAEDFLDLLLSIELSEGRVRDERWGPRTLDLDIITFGDQLIDSERLHVPHPRMAERGFVLVPLLDIAADTVVDGKTISDYAAAIDCTGIVLSEAELVIS